MKDFRTDQVRKSFYVNKMIFLLLTLTPHTHTMDVIT
jgi:hypothetical protein